jgi:uncharacterized delta-60 repeat protein
MVCVRRSILYLFFMTLFFPVLAKAVVPASYLDTSFNRPYGYATYPTPYMYGERPNAVVIQRDGKIVVVDTTAVNRDEAKIAVTRYNPDGIPDGSFSVSGTAVYDGSGLSYATDVAIQLVEDEEKIIVAGFRSLDENLYDLILLRYNAGGSLDTSFTGGFTTRVGFDGVNTSASIAVQGDGKILVATQRIGGTGAKSLLLLRFDQNGSLDTNFGTDGVVEYSYYPYEGPPVEGLPNDDNITGRTVKITPDGRNILVIIKVFAYSVLLRFDMNGNIDDTFNSVPLLGLQIPGGSYSGALPRGMDVQSDGKIVVVGETTTVPFVARYTPDGNPDPTFGEGSGVVYFNYKEHFGYVDDPIRSSNVRNVALQPDGGILIVGSCPMSHTINGVSDDMDIFLARYNARGSLDSSFGVNGVVTFDGGWRDGNTYYGDFGEALAIQSDGKIVVVGSVRVYNDPADPDPAESHSDMVIMRFGDQPNPEHPSIEVSPESHNYGEVEKGKNKAKQFTLSNIGQSDVAIDEIELTGDDTIDFAIDPGTCQNLTPIIMAGESCTITVSFIPGSEGMKAVTLRIVLNNLNARVVEGTPVEVSLQGTGIIVQVSYTLSVSTDGNGVGSVRSKPRGISCGVKTSECTGEFPAGKEVILYPVVEDEQTRFVGWSGACTGRKECRVMMDSAKEVKATFMADPTIIVCPQSKNFKEVRLGKMRAAFIFVKNGTKSGKVPLRITGITLTGSTSSFSIFKDECSTRDLQPKEVCAFGIVFDPDSPTLHAAEAQISSTDPVSPIKTVALSGKGVAPPPPKPPRPPRKK